MSKKNRAEPQHCLLEETHEHRGVRQGSGFWGVGVLEHLSDDGHFLSLPVFICKIGIWYLPLRVILRRKIAYKKMTSSMPGR